MGAKWEIVHRVADHDPQTIVEAMAQVTTLGWFSWIVEQTYLIRHRETGDELEVRAHDIDDLSQRIASGEFGS